MDHATVQMGGWVGGGLMTCVVDCQQRLMRCYDDEHVAYHARLLFQRRFNAGKDLWSKVPELVKKGNKQNAWNPLAKTKKRKLLIPHVVNDPVTLFTQQTCFLKFLCMWMPLMISCEPVLLPSTLLRTTRRKQSPLLRVWALCFFVFDYKFLAVFFCYRSKSN